MIEFFAEKAQVIDVFGKRWNREEIMKGSETLFSGYAKKNATPVVEGILVNAGDLFVANFPVEECNPCQRTTRLDASDECRSGSRRRVIGAFSNSRHSSTAVVAVQNCKQKWVGSCFVNLSGDEPCGTF